MLSLLGALFIDWDVDPVIFSVTSSMKIQYYGVLFVLAFVCGYKVQERMFKSEGIRMEWLDKLIIYVAIATIAGARLGHCLFYDWDYFSEHLLEIFLPVRFEPHYEFIGYRGLASHGAAVGIIAALWYYSKKVSKRSIFWVLDRAVIPIALSGFFIRMGNLMNSEIVGNVTEMPWGFRFLLADGPAALPRHPAQLYESLWYLLSFAILLWTYWKTDLKSRKGFLFGMFLLLIFAFRFFVEYLKEPQEAWEVEMRLNMGMDMGQLLSIPFVLVGVWMLFRNRKRTV
ncbi:prolipoprotein diacylglyceryl transferase [Bacteroidia bacterium]|nr:prolipoprotein diacylglyceryl transferase [Bacteroidia bacterium]